MLTSTSTASPEAIRHRRYRRRLRDKMTLAHSEVPRRIFEALSRLRGGSKR